MEPIFKFKSGDRVRMKYYGRYATGEVTIVKNNLIKVLFDGDYDLPYDYYDGNDLEIISHKTELQNQSQKQE